MTAATRITLGLVCSMLGILMAADFFEVLPNEERLVLGNRIQLIETMAVSSTPMLESNQMTKLQAVLDALVRRQEGLLSAAFRDRSGTIVASAGPHRENWPETFTDSNEEYIQVSLSADGVDNWGVMECVFSPMRAAGWQGYVVNKLTVLLAFCAPVGFFAFRFFLKMVLKNLDPSNAVPRRVREALDILTEGMMIVGLNDRVLLANKAMENMTGYGVDELIGVEVGTLGFRSVDSSADSSEASPWNLALETNTTVTNTMLTPDDGSNRVFRVNCSPLVGTDGKHRGVMVTFDDVTVLEENKIELRLAKVEAETLKDEAEAANKAKSDFLANMSHEIRNPMNAIVGFTDILRRGMEESAETRVQYLNTIHSSGTHLVGLINDILDLSKIESGKMELELCECQPYQLMSEVVGVMEMKAQEQNLQLEHSIEGVVPATINSDPTRLRQILMNLVGNAIKFTTNGGVKIIADTVQFEGRSQMRFRVVDTGIGMTDEQCGKIFEEFVQADTSVTRRFGGTGLGLAISKRLTEALGGQVTVSSVPGEGSTFGFTVDTGDVANSEMIDDLTASSVLLSQQKTIKRGVTVRFKPARVLVTDDTPANRQLVGLVLRKAGLTVEEAENGLQAVERATTEDFDLLLMDMQMPVMDGFTATKKLRQQGLTKPIFALTANVMQADRERCEEAGCTGFLTKPIDIDKLLTALSEVLEVEDSLVEQFAIPSTPSPLQQPGSCRPENPNPIDAVMDMVDRALAPSPRRERLESTLPLDIPEFREIVLQFVDGIPAMISEMLTAWQERDLVRLRELAHKLKGTGGTVGFPQFTDPAGRLQDLAESNTEAGIHESLEELTSLAEAVWVPECEPI